MKKITKLFQLIGILALLPLFIAASCASQSQDQAQPGTVEIIKRGAGTPLGTVTATAAVNEVRASKTITGDTKQYGFVENIPVSRVTTGKRPAKEEQQQYTIPTDPAEIAYTNAIYDIIQQVKAKGGDAVTDVVSNVQRNYDIETGIETVKVSVKAEAIKLP